jgi:isopenicillin-N synthase
MDSEAKVPTIDISPLLNGCSPEQISEVALQIKEACLDSGFFYASNHGIDVERLQDVVNAFHQRMTLAEKFKLAINAYNKENDHVRNGYYMVIPGKKAVESFCYLNPNFDDNHEMIVKKAPLHEVNWWPEVEKHPGFQEFCEKYFLDMLELSKKLLKGFALALGKDQDFFEEYLTTRGSLSAVSLIRYPFLEDYPPVKTGPDGALLSFEDHKDVSLITVLFQTPVQNLQVQLKDGVFYDIRPSGDCFLVNCGTYMDHITHGYFHAPVHRVKFVNEERLSLPFFVNLDNDAIIPPFIPDGDHQRENAENQPISYGDYFGSGLHNLIVKNGQT